MFDTLLLVLGFCGLLISVVVKLLCRPIKPRGNRHGER